MRLNKYLSESGACSRREADALIAEGRVTINGTPATLGTQVADGDDVRLDGERVGAARKKSRPVYIALNKPVGITCTTERHVDGNIIDFVNHPERVFPIGRLDKDSEGLILLTNDGDIVNEVLRAEHNHEKEYVVAVDRPYPPEFLEQMAAGVRLSDATTKPSKVTRLGPKIFQIVLTQGLNRQIRRMCEALGFTVEGLRRVRIMHIRLGELPLGRWRQLSQQEVQPLLPRAKQPPHASGGGNASGGDNRFSGRRDDSGRSQSNGRRPHGGGRDGGGDGRGGGGRGSGGGGRSHGGHPGARGGQRGRGRGR
ncbi:MAG TPA: pseudouridine synthase [Kofleriaceae bacterium]|nr:pseudouridine synthase [Kofleriaceae bacterium]